MLWTKTHSWRKKLCDNFPDGVKTFRLVRHRGRPVNQCAHFHFENEAYFGINQRIVVFAIELNRPTRNQSFQNHMIELFSCGFCILNRFFLLLIPKMIQHSKFQRLFLWSMLFKQLLKSSLRTWRISFAWIGVRKNGCSHSDNVNICIS